MGLFRRPQWALPVILALSALRPAWGAGVDVPLLELISRATPGSGTLELATQGEIDIAVRGGVKFGGEISLGLISPFVEQDITERLALTGNGTALTLKSASVIIREAFALPLSLTYFVGESDALGSGAAFADVFGSAAVASEYAGFLYFPDSVRYEGVHTVNGTGVRIAMERIAEKYYAALYAYQDAYFFEPAGADVVFEPGRYSFDVHGLAELGKLRLEAFAGATVPVSSYGAYRGGVVFHAADEGGEFLAQVGVPRWDPAHRATSLDLFMILFEARIHLGLVSIVPTVFLHPGYYLQQETHEAGLVDFNLKLSVGDRSGSIVRGGLESNIAFKEEDLQDLEARVSPFVAFATAGALWQIKTNVQVFPSIDFEAFVGVKAEF